MPDLAWQLSTLLRSKFLPNMELILRICDALALVRYLLLVRIISSSMAYSIKSHLKLLSYSVQRQTGSHIHCRHAVQEHNPLHCCLRIIAWIGYRSIRPRVDPHRVDPPHVRPKRGRSAPTSGTIRPKFWVVPPQHP